MNPDHDHYSQPAQERARRSARWSHRTSEGSETSKESGRFPEFRWLRFVDKKKWNNLANVRRSGTPSIAQEEEDSQRRRHNRRTEKRATHRLERWNDGCGSSCMGTSFGGIYCNSYTRQKFLMLMLLMEIFLRFLE